jgi:hypothetical protein
VTIVKRIGLLLIFVIIGAIISFVFFNVRSRGTFVKWDNLGTPSGKVVKVVWADYVKTESGDLYHYEYNSSCTVDCWIKSDEVAPPIDSENWMPLDQCIDLYNLPSLKNFTDSKIVCEYSGPGIRLTITAIDEAGNVYSWRRGTGETDGNFIFFSPFIGAFYGFLAIAPVLIVSFLIDIGNWIKKKMKQ